MVEAQPYPHLLQDHGKPAPFYGEYMHNMALRSIFLIIHISDTVTFRYPNTPVIRHVTDLSVVR